MSALSPAAAIDRLRAAFGRPPEHDTPHRSLHAKGAFYAGTFTATPRAAELCTAGHLQGSEVPILVRWSNGGGNHRAPDKAPDVRGMSVSFKLADGTATDLLGQTAPRFPVKTPEEFLAITEAAVHPKKMPGFLLRHRHAVAPLLANAKAKALVSPTVVRRAGLLPRPRLPVGRGRRHRELGALRAAAEVIDRSGGHVQRPAPAPRGDRLAAGRRPGDLHPRGQRRRRWRRPARPDVGLEEPGGLRRRHLTITGVTDDPEADGGVVVFDPTRIVAGIELSDDPILLFRPGAYSESVKRRLG